MNEKTEGILLCGGKGERFKNVTGANCPKSLFKVNDQELISYSVDNLSTNLISKFNFVTLHLAEQVEGWICQNINKPFKVFLQKEPGITNAISLVTNESKADHFVCCNTDEIRIGLDMSQFLNSHFANCQNGKIGTMLISPQKNLARHRLITIDETKKIIATELKPTRYLSDKESSGLVNSGLIIFSQKIKNYLSKDGSWSSIIDQLVAEEKLSAYISPQLYYANVGTEDELREVQMNNWRVLK